MNDDIGRELFGDDRLIAVPPGYELEIERIEYRVRAWDEDGTGVLLETTTFGNWEVQSDYLITWDRAGLKRGTLLPAYTTTITTEEVVHKGKHAGEEETAANDADESTNEGDASVAADGEATIHSSTA